MRRLAFAAVCGTLVLAGCSDQTPSPTEPSIPPPQQHVGTCRPTVLFPLREVSRQILDVPTSQVFATNKLKVIALAKAVATAILWDTCRRIPAQKFAIEFVNWIDRNASGVSPDKTIKLKIAILNGVGVLVPLPPPGSDPTDFLVVGYDPTTSTQDMAAATPSGRAGIWLRAGNSGFPAFNEFSVIVVRRKGDHEDFDAFFDAAHQPGPVWDYNVTNSSTTNTDESHEVANYGSVIIAFCYQVGGDYEGEQMWHITVEGNLEPVESADIPPGLRVLLTACPEPPIIGSSGGGLSGFAHATWSAAGHHLGRFARLLFLPTPLRASVNGAAVVGKGPSGGTPVGLSPFTIVLEGCGYGGYCSYGGY